MNRVPTQPSVIRVRKASRQDARVVDEDVELAEAVRWPAG